MKFDIPTLAFISSLIFVTQFIGLFVQYLVNKTQTAVIWWLFGSALWAIGVILAPMVSIKSLEIFARVANPLIVTGEIFLFIGVNKFLDRKVNKWLLVSIFLTFILSYYYFMLIKNDISSRSIIVTLTMAIISTMTAYSLFSRKEKNIFNSTNFTGLVFCVYSLVSLVRIYYLVSSPPMESYNDQLGLIELAFLIPIFASVLWTFGFIIMLNQQLNEANIEEKEKFKMIFNTSPDAAIISKLEDGKIIDVNSGFLNMSGYSRKELINNTTININIWHNPRDRDSFIEELRRNEIIENKEFVFQRKDMRLLTGLISAKITRMQSIPYIVSSVHDITTSKQAEVLLRESEELYRSILNASPDDITITDLEGRIQVISPAAKKMFGFEPEYDGFLNAHLLDYIVPKDRERAMTNIISMHKGNYSGPHEYHGVRKDGSIFDIESNSGIIHGANGQPVKMVFVVRNISDRKAAEKRIQHLIQQLEKEKKTAQLNANTDSLTGLANRRFFDDTLNVEFLRLKRSRAPLSLIMLDVDYFKKFNDQYGHIAGDDCLRSIGTLLKGIVGRVTDFAARYGGEEFVLILTETDATGAKMLAERIRKSVEDLKIPHSGSDIAKFVTVSLGVVTVQPHKIISPGKIIDLADEAMYSAKKGGRNQIYVSSENSF